MCEPCAPFLESLCLKLGSHMQSDKISANITSFHFTKNHSFVQNCSAQLIYSTLWCIGHHSSSDLNSVFGAVLWVSLSPMFSLCILSIRYLYVFPATHNRQIGFVLKLTLERYCNCMTMVCGLHGPVSFGFFFTLLKYIMFQLLENIQIYTLMQAWMLIKQKMCILVVVFRIEDYIKMASLTFIAVIARGYSPWQESHA